MKERELREAAECAACSKKIGESIIPMFHRLTLQTYTVNTGALRRQSGLEMQLGNVALAQVMGVDEDMAEKSGEEVTVTICFDCMSEQIIPALIFTEDD